MHSGKTREAIRAIALFEGAKGVLVLAAGLGLLALVNRDLEEMANDLVRHMHLNPAKHIPQIFIHAAARVGDMHLWMLAAGAAAYCLVRFIEAYGLWGERWWAEGFAAASGAIYVPFEGEKVLDGEGIVAILALAINLAIVAFMIYALVKRKRRARRERATAA